MSLCKYSYGKSMYFFNPDKINYINSVATGGYSEADLNLSPTDSMFNILFDNQPPILIEFANHSEGINWIQDNLLSGECPTDSGV